MSADLGEDQQIIINEKDGLPNVHPNLLNEAEINSPDASEDEFEDLPTSLIVTNIHDSVFVNSGEDLAVVKVTS